LGGGHVKAHDHPDGGGLPLVLPGLAIAFCQAFLLEPIYLARNQHVPGRLVGKVDFLPVAAVTTSQG
jgi:hypothetical protein